MSDHVDKQAIDALARQLLEEDIGTGDLSTLPLPDPSRLRHAHLLSNEKAIICGCTWFDSVFRQLDPAIRMAWHVKDGDPISEGQRLCMLYGKISALLSGERAALNILQTLSGTATTTRHYADLLSGGHSVLLDTRKTLPGLRYAQKYAVRCGGGCNHRLGLFDGILLKENHLSAYGSLTEAITAVKAHYPDRRIEVEVETADELHAALDAGADMILLDNFDVAAIEQAVCDTAGRAKLEASGAINDDTLRAIANTGVDYISVGALTKHVRAIDFSMRITEDA